MTNFFFQIGCGMVFGTIIAMVAEAMHLPDWAVVVHTMVGAMGATCMGGGWK